MARKDIIMLRQQELKRLYVIKKGFEGVMKQVEAADTLSISDRQIRRLIKMESFIRSWTRQTQRKFR